MARRKSRHTERSLSLRNQHMEMIDRIIKSEPYVRVVDRRNSYNDRLQQHRARLRKQAILSMQAPRRQARVRKAQIMKTVLGNEGYKKLHDCKREWRKLLSWRSAQGSGRNRTSRELKNNHESFKRKDC